MATKKQAKPVAKKAGRRSDIDWEALERDFRIGTLTTKEIATLHGVAYSTLRSRIKDCGWVRDLSETVRIATKAALLDDAKARAVEIGTRIGVEIGTKSALDQISGVEAQVGENVRAVRSHLEASDRLKRIANGLMDDLEDAMSGQRLIATEIEKLAEDDPARAAFLRKATELKSKVETADKLGSVVSKYVMIDRQALGLDSEKASGNSNYEDMLRAIAKESL